MTITPEHRELLRESAITDPVIDSSGIVSTARGLSFPWNDGVQPTVWQLRPDQPHLNDQGDPIKYVFPKGSKVPLNRLRDEGDACRQIIIAEGTKQQYAVLSHAPGNMAVYGVSGCWGFKHADLTVVRGREVYLMLDADIETNLDVWTAAETVMKDMQSSGAEAVHIVRTTGRGKEGVDDVLARTPEDKRAEALRTWLASAPAKLPKKPKAKRPVQSELDAEASKYFRQRDKPLAFQPLDYARSVLDRFPAAITAEKNIALYANGVYSVDEDAILAVIVKTLGNYYTPSFLKNTTDVLRGLLKLDNKILPEAMTEPLLNCVNGMVDLRTGRLKDHDPAYMSHVQTMVPYDPEMPTPTYDQWLRDALRSEHHTDAEIEMLVADIEETSGTMLDPSRTPSKALFLFGPSRSGKSTYLRLLRAVAGAVNTSAVTLHELGDDPFASANLYGKMLNVAADLSNAHVNDLSKFKMATGEDVVHANRKYGQQFSFTNQAFFAFSANELPTVSEASRAYAERMKPFEFPNSFAGREDKSLETRLMAELPGILARWVKAYGRFLARNGYRATDAATQRTFEAKSDRVAQFFQDMCTVTEAQYGQNLPAEAAIGRRDAARAFNEWAERNGGSKMGERAFFQRFAQMTGVTDVRIGKGSRAFNVTVARADEDMWTGEDVVPLADPIPASGVLDEQSQEAAPVAASGLADPCPVPEATSSVEGAQKPTQAFSFEASWATSPSEF